MFSKLSVIRKLPLPRVPLRHLGGLTPLEKFERLRKLCCTSNAAKKVEEEHQKLRPQVPEVDPCKTCCPDTIQELMNLRCKRAMIVGGASGIGFETADCLLRQGLCSVIIADINQEAGIAAVKKLCAAHGNSKAIYLKTDIAEQPSIEMAFREVYRCFNQIEIYINSVGVYNETPQCWDKMIRTNLIGCVRGTLLAINFMSKNPCDESNEGTVIVNVSSYGSLGSVPSMPLFSAASNGINGLTSSFGQDFHYLKSKVRCVTVCPACTDSNLLKNMSRLHYNSQWAGASNKAMGCCTKQSAKIVGRAIASAVRFGPSGSVFVVKDGKYYKYDMPDYEKIMRQETVLL